MVDEFSELDALLNEHAELEARFKELEDRVDLEEMKAEVQWAQSHQAQAVSTYPKVSFEPGSITARTGETVEIDDSGPPPARPPSPKPAPPEPGASSGLSDPTAALKARLAGKVEKLFLVVVCPSCGRNNRTQLERLRSAVPRCGHCGGDLTRHR